MPKRAYCIAGKHWPEYLLAEVIILDEDGNESDVPGILLNSYGESLNTWFDGTRGVPAITLDHADVDGAVCFDSDCPGFGSSVDWRNSE